MNIQMLQFRDYVQELREKEVRYNKMYELAAASLKDTKNETVQIRKAKAIAFILDNVEQVIHPYETIVGTIQGMWPEVEIEKDFKVLLSKADDIIYDFTTNPNAASDKSRRYAFIAPDRVNTNITHNQYQDLVCAMKEKYAGSEKINNQQIGRELDRYFTFDYGEDAEIVNDLPWISSNHLNLNYKKIVKIGLEGYYDELAKYSEINQDKDFYNALKITIEAISNFIKRYSKKAEKQANLCQDELRRVQLMEISDILNKISFHKPDTFKEALQLVWMIHTIGNLCGGGALSFARFDQYMFPFYKRDIDTGIICKDEVEELLYCFWNKINEPKIGTVQSICLGGLDTDGNDGANELTKLCLKVARSLKTPYPNISVRVNNCTPKWVFEEIIETIKLGFAQPMILNDDMWIKNLVNLRGHKKEDAVDYYNMGCVEMMIEGKQPNWAGCGGIDYPGLLELVFNNGKENIAGLEGIRSGNLQDFRRFDDFMNAYIVQLKHQLHLIYDNTIKQIEQKDGMWYDPLGSLFVDDCVKNGIDIFNGGAACEPVRAIGGFGLGTAVDSLSAIKTFVYDKKEITLHELNHLLKNDFKGNETLRLRLENKTPNYGNSIKEVDEIASKIFNIFTDTILSFNNKGLYGKFAPIFFSYTRHVNMGELISATPNGRKQGDPMSDAIGPSQGKDASGPTNLMNSILNLDHSKITGGYAMNLKISGQITKDKEGQDALLSLIKTYFSKGGLQLQVNYVDADTLKKAQEEPQRYKGLVVRVAGFCEYFSNLDRQLQNEIINRTEHQI